MNISKWRLYMNAIVCFLGILFALPNVLDDGLLKKMPSWLPTSKVPLGLDLQGGSHLLLEMDTSVVDKTFYETLITNIQRVLSDNNISADADDVVGNESSVMIHAEEHIPLSVSAKLKEIAKDAGVTLNFEKNGVRNNIVIGLSDAARDRLHNEAMDRAMEIVRRRVDDQGTKEISLQRSGSNRIALQMPGIQDPDYVKELLGKTAQLTFHLVDENLPEIAEGARNPHALGSVYLPHKERGRYGNVMIAIKKRAVVSGLNLKNAGISTDRNGNPAVSFEFDKIGAEEFANVTSRNVGKRLAIVLDGQVISAPNINTPITGGSGEITGNFSIEEANELSVLLKSGALPAPLHTVEEKTVGPDLGADSIKAGIIATIISIVVIMLFMFYEYRLFGFAANIALIMNLVLLIAGLSIMQATLTLPGIAGIALTLGMAVDANVLINERIREEYRKGTKILACLEFGYTKAIGTIVDSNLTTIFGGLALYVFGSSSVKGFAVTLIMGILISMFTAISLTKCIKVLYFSNKKTSDIVIP